MTMGLLSELLLKNDDNFTWLSLTNCEIGVPIPELTQALLRNHTLRKVSCHAGFLGSLHLEDLQLLMETLAKLSHLQDLWLALPPKQAWRSSAVLQIILLSSPSSRLQKLTVRGIDDAGCHVLCRALCQPNACMTDLQIRGSTSSSSSTINTATVNNNNIDSTQQQQQPSKVTRQGILAVAKMLEVNRSLERFDFCYKGLDNASLDAMAKALLVNRKLQKLDLTSPNNNNNNRNNNNNAASASNKKKESLAKGFEALATTMRQNFSLHHLNTSAEGDSKYMIDLLTKLNRTGARAMMQNTKSGLEDVLEVLLQHQQQQADNTTTTSAANTNNTTTNNKDNSSCSSLFELLSINPALWDPVKANVQGLLLENHTNSNTRRTSMKLPHKKRLSMVKMTKSSALDPSSSFAAAASATTTRTTTTSAAKMTTGATKAGCPVPMATPPSDAAAATAYDADAPKKKIKPVMSRWNENIFSNLEREKIKNFKRWTPTVIETTTTTATEVPAASTAVHNTSEDARMAQQNGPTDLATSTSSTAAVDVIAAIHNISSSEQKTAAADAAAASPSETTTTIYRNAENNPARVEDIYAVAVQRESARSNTAAAVLALSESNVKECVVPLQERTIGDDKATGSMPPVVAGKKSSPATASYSSLVNHDDDEEEVGSIAATGAVECVVAAPTPTEAAAAEAVAVQGLLHTSTTTRTTTLKTRNSGNVISAANHVEPHEHAAAGLSAVNDDEKSEKSAAATITTTETASTTPTATSPLPQKSNNSHKRIISENSNVLSTATNHIMDHHPGAAAMLGEGVDKKQVTEPDATPKQHHSTSSMTVPDRNNAAAVDVDVVPTTRDAKSPTLLADDDGGGGEIPPTVLSSFQESNSKSTHTTGDDAVLVPETVVSPNTASSTCSSTDNTVILIKTLDGNNNDVQDRNKSENEGQPDDDEPFAGVYTAVAATGVAMVFSGFFSTYVS